MIKINNLSIETLKGRKLIEKLSFTLNDGDKLAIIGEEGNGKSTLIKAIFDKNLISQYCKVSGEIIKNNCCFGYLEQKLNALWGDFSVIEYFLKENPESEPCYDFYEEYYDIKKTLKNFNFNIDYLDNGQLIKNLSGGEKVKLQLAKLQLKNPNVLLLDEPTNDLDIEMLQILQDFINNYNGIVIFISHDETLLENTANSILHIEQLIKKTTPKATFKKVGYNQYIEERKQSIEHQTQIAYSERREKAKKEEVLRQIRQKVENALVSAKKDASAGRIIAKKMASIKSQENKLENQEMTEIPDFEEAIKLVINEKITLPSKKVVLNFSEKTLEVGNKVLSNNIELKIIGPERIAIIGKNGCGKTTLLKQILEKLKLTSSINVGYFSQNYSEILDYNDNAVNQVMTNTSTFNPRTFLGSLKFTSDEMLHPIKDLSEGQKAKICLLKLITSDYNVLVLDEPTRNLSPLSNPVIRKMLQKYNGAIITVSHDRKFIKEICDKVYLLNSNGLKRYSMNDFINDNFSNEIIL